MALSGTYTRNLDEHQRIAVPKSLREQFTEGKLDSLYVAPGTERSLSLYSPETFAAEAERLARRSTNRALVRNYLRLFYARAEQVALDKQGRIRIPERLVDLAGLKHDVVLLGVHDHAEIWDRQLWEEFLTRNAAQFDDMATQAFE
ncbi:MAG: cell division protein [Planctomycetaceae bacterium]